MQWVLYSESAALLLCFLAYRWFRRNLGSICRSTKAQACLRCARLHIHSTLKRRNTLQWCTARNSTDIHHSTNTTTRGSSGACSMWGSRSELKMAEHTSVHTEPRRYILGKQNGEREGRGVRQHHSILPDIGTSGAEAQQQQRKGSNRVQRGSSRPLETGTHGASLPQHWMGEEMRT